MEGLIGAGRMGLPMVRRLAGAGHDVVAVARRSETAAALAELASTGQTGADVRSIASRFSGAWPYLCVLAQLAGIDDPLDERPHDRGQRG